jgi:dihydroorotate dehydrogenase
MLLDFGARLLRSLPPEASHRAAVRLTRLVEPLLPAARPDDPRLATTAFGLRFPSPVGLAAGFDKHGEVPNAMLKLGFGFVEVGTVTLKPQPGNPKPRVFRLAKDRAIINRMGFNSRGAYSIAEGFGKLEKKGIIGVNIGANKITDDRILDYVESIRVLAAVSDYLTINVSSPNTPGLRDLQKASELRDLLTAVRVARSSIASKVPLLLKISPDLDPVSMDQIAEISLEHRIDGVIVSNSTTRRPADLRSKWKSQQGGLSGLPLMELSTRALLEMRKRMGSRAVLVGTGGIASGADAYAKIRAGAHLVQLYTALTFSGPSLVTKIKRDLVHLLRLDGFDNISAAVGVDCPGG